MVPLQASSNCAWLCSALANPGLTTCRKPRAYFPRFGWCRVILTNHICADKSSLGRSNIGIFQMFVLFQNVGNLESRILFVAVTELSGKLKKRNFDNAFCSKAEISPVGSVLLVLDHGHDRTSGRSCSRAPPDGCLRWV